MKYRSSSHNRSHPALPCPLLLLPYLILLLPYPTVTHPSLPSSMESMLTGAPLIQILRIDSQLIKIKGLPPLYPSFLNTLDNTALPPNSTLKLFVIRSSNKHKHPYSLRCHSYSTAVRQ